jgi:rod shape-determining protein MreC
MRSLFAFIFRLRFFLIFVVLELLSAWMIVTNNSYQSFAFLSSSNQLIGGIYDMTSGVTGYFNLGIENEGLMAENKRLRQELYRLGQTALADSAFTHPFGLKMIPAKVTNNSILRNENFITLNKGSLQGVERGMGVIAPEGIVGLIKEVSDHFSTAYSVLHASISVSSQIKRTKTLVTTQWMPSGGANDYTTANLQHVPFHVSIQLGDTIETSGYNTVYPEGVLVGFVSEVIADTSKNYQTIKIHLATDFSRIGNVYIVGDSLKTEKVELEQKN